MPVDQSTRKTPLPPSKTASLWMAVALALVTLAVFCPVTGFQFVNLDDPEFITANPHVQAGLTADGFKWAWRNEVTGDWHPLTMLSLMLDCQLVGLKPWWPHLVNLLLHAANTVLLFALFNRMTGAMWRSAVVAALFALHPLRVESVAWVCERKDVLSTLFWFLTAWAYVRYAEKQWRVASGQWLVYYGLSLLFFALGLMSKPMLVTVPCALLLLDYWPLGRMKPGASLWRLAMEKIPFFAMSAALCMVTLRFQKQAGGMLSLQNFPLTSRLGNALVSYVRYIEMMFWPRHLAGLYPIRSDPWPWWEVTLAALLLLAVSALVLWQRRRPYLAMGWFWYLGTLVPVIGLVQAGNQALADRFTYVPLIGLFVIVVWGGWELAGAWRLAGFAPVATAAALTACAALTVHQEFYWKDSETFCKRMIDVTSNNYVAHNNLGMAFGNGKIDDAIEQFQEAIRIKPDYIDALNNLGAALGGKGKYDDAIRQDLGVLRMEPNLATARYNLGVALCGKGQFDEAIVQLQEAIRLKPDYAAAYDKLGMAFGSHGQIDEAIRQLREAIRLDPHDPEACYHLGAAFGNKGQIGEAISQFREAVHLNPNIAEIHNSLGMALGSNGQIDEAIGQFREAIRLQPDDAEAHNNLGSALGRKGQIDEAIKEYQETIRLKPNLTEARNNLARALRMKNAPAGR